MYGLKFSNSLYILGLILATGFLNLPNTNGARILGVFTSPSKSHFMVHMSIMKALAERGHDITVVSRSNPIITHPSVRHIVIPPTKEQEEIQQASIKEMANKRSDMWAMIKGVFSLSDMFTMQAEALKDERFTKLYKEKFDLVFVGYFFNDFQLGIGAKFNCPIIVNWMGAPFEIVNDFVGNPWEVSYVPNVNLAVKAGEPMDFGKRFQNLIASGFIAAVQNGVGIYMNSLYNELFPSDNFPSYRDIKKNVSLLFVNSHFSEGSIRPNVPAVVEIGGIQIKPKPDPLPKDIGDFLDSAKKDGAILFCLGSNLKSSIINPKIVQAIFKTLASLKQKVIWKWEDPENVPGKSPNILYKKWIPQDDILAHPNMKLFITHAGKGGVAEAQYHGVPMVALPVFADQPANAENMASAGYGQHLDLFSLTENTFKKAILEVLENPKYSENVKRFSELYRDRPMLAKESVVYWTEYILRHHGAQHMQSPLVHYNFFQKTSLDVIGALFLALYIIFKVIKLIFKAILNKLKSKKQKQH